MFVAEKSYQRVEWSALSAKKKPNKRLKVGDTIKCATSKEMVDLMMLLAKEGIETDFLYEKDGEHGLWLEIVEVMEYGRKES